MCVICSLPKTNVWPCDPNDGEQTKKVTDTTTEQNVLETFLDEQETENDDEENEHLEPGMKKVGGRLRMLRRRKK